jgi:tetratricopeptide (TPR) repeat protein
MRLGIRVVNPCVKGGLTTVRPFLLDFKKPHLILGPIITMEPNLPPEEETPIPSNQCISCQHPVIEPGHPTPLCSDCRRKFIRYPIPLGIKLFGGFVAAILIFALAGMRSNLSAGIHYERGRKAIVQKNYFTAEKELNAVGKKISSFTEAREYLAIASFYNQDLQTFATEMQALQGVKIEDEQLYTTLNSLMEKSGNYFPSDSFVALIDRYQVIDKIPDTVFRHFLTNYDNELLPATHYANILFDREKYTACDSMLNIVLGKDAVYFNALNLKSGVKRVLKDFDSSVYYADRILSLNKESTFAMASKARSLLRQKKDAAGLEWALKSVNLDRSDDYCTATLALAYHFNNQPVARDKLLNELKKDSIGSTYAQFALDVISGKEEFRN